MMFRIMADYWASLKVMGEEIGGKRGKKAEEQERGKKGEERNEKTVWGRCEIQIIVPLRIRQWPWEALWGPTSIRGWLFICLFCTCVTLYLNKLLQYPLSWPSTLYPPSPIYSTACSQYSRLKTSLIIVLSCSKIVSDFPLPTRWCTNVLAWAFKALLHSLTLTFYQLIPLLFPYMKLVPSSLFAEHT